MLAFIWWLLVGLVAGGLARLLVPGRQSMGLIMTMLLGLAGSLIGGVISSVVLNYRMDDPTFHAGGLVLSTVGAIIALAIYVSSTQRPRNVR